MDTFKNGKREIKFRYDLLDKDENFKYTLDNILDANITFNSLAAIKKTARFTLKENKEIDWLNDKIQPFVILKNKTVAKEIIKQTITETFETSNFNFEFKGDWQRNNLHSKEGLFSFSNKDIEDNQSSSATLEVTLLEEGTVFFNYLVSSEGNYDLLNFYIDGVLKRTDSGNHEWRNDTFILTKGTHILEWKYIKDDAMSSNEDTVYIDNITITNVKKEINIYVDGIIDHSLGIYKLSSPIRSKSNNIVKRVVEAYDCTLLLKQDKISNRLFIASGTKYIDIITNLIKSVGVTKINIEYTPVVFNGDREFEIGTDKLNIINTLLKELNYNTLSTDNSGYFVSNRYKLPMYREIDHTYKDDELSVLYDNVTEELDMFNTPNKWVLVASNPDTLPLTSIYINNNPLSPTSVQNLGGRIITDVIKIDNVLDQKTLDAMTEKISYEAMNVYGYLDFETAIMPNHDILNIVHVEYSDMNINSNYEEIEWSMNLKAGERMVHKCRKVVMV